MSKKPNNLLTFGDFRLEIAERRLWRGGEVVSLAPKVFDLLVFFASNPGRLLEKDELVAALWPGTFVEESNLSVNISALRRAIGDSLIETVPKRGYRFLGEVLKAPEPPPPPPPSKARWPFALALVLGLATTAWLIARHEPADAPPESLAILPFLPVADVDTQRSLGLGMADAVITQVTALRKIEVRPTSLVNRYRALDRDPLAAGRALSVEAVLDGRIQLVDNRVRVTAQLLRVSDGHQLWAQTFDDKFANIFDLQDAIARRIAQALIPRHSMAAAKRTTQNAEAYQLYLRGQFLASKRVNAATETAIEAFEKAIALDPNYPLPYAALAHSKLIRAGEGFGGELRNQAKTAAMRAISLDDQLAESQLAMGQVFMRADWDWVGAERAFRRAVELNENLASAHAALSTIFTALGRHDDALKEIQTACWLDPENASWQADLAWTLTFARRYDEAIIEGQRAVGLDAWSYSARRQLSKAYLMKRSYPAAIAEINHALDINGTRRRRVLTEVATAYAGAGDQAKVDAAMKEINRPDWSEPFPHYEMAVLETALGHTDAALEQVRVALEKRITRVVWMREDPELDALRSDPRFQRLLEQLKLPRSSAP